MNDILSPLLFVLGSEHQAFWCFTDVMRRMVGLLHGNLVHWLFMYSSRLFVLGGTYKLLYKCMYARLIHYAYIKGPLPIKLLRPLLPSHHLSSIQRSTFSDLTLSQPLDTVAKLCCYASPQLHDHISTLWQSHMLYTEARDCVGDVMIVAMHIFLPRQYLWWGRLDFLLQVFNSAYTLYLDPTLIVPKQWETKILPVTHTNAHQSLLFLHTVAVWNSLPPCVQNCQSCIAFF